MPSAIGRVRSATIVCMSLAHGLLPVRLIHLRPLSGHGRLDGIVIASVIVASTRGVTRRQRPVSVRRPFSASIVPCTTGASPIPSLKVVGAMGDECRCRCKMRKGGVESQQLGSGRVQAVGATEAS
jgi:hypothetical protein